MNIFRHIQPERIDDAKRKAVYTFIFGDYDDLKSPTIMTPGWDYICFTDDPTHVTMPLVFAWAVLA
jgi:hypothetical protein